MEETFTARAIVLKREPFRERDSRIIVYSEDRGKLELIARGTARAASKLAGHIEPLNLVDLMVVRGKQFDYVGTALNADFFYQLKTDFDKIKIVAPALGKLNSLLKPGIQDEVIFKNLRNFLEFINSFQAKDVYKYELLSAMFLLQTIIRLGYRPELHHCLHCRRQLAAKGNTFSLRQGGIICQTCAKHKDKDDLTITENAIKILRMNDEKMDKLSNLQIDSVLSSEVSRIINLFIQYQI